MNSINHAFHGLASSLLLSVGLTKLAEKLDTLQGRAGRTDVSSEACWLCHFKPEAEVSSEACWLCHFSPEADLASEACWLCHFSPEAGR